MPSTASRWCTLPGRGRRLPEGGPDRRPMVSLVTAETETERPMMTTTTTHLVPRPRAVALAFEHWRTLLIKEWPVNTPRGLVVVSETLTFAETRRLAPLTPEQQWALGKAMVQIGAGAVHPCMNAVQSPLFPYSVWTCSPWPGMTITWHDRWDKPGQNVLMTLTVRPPVPRPVRWVGGGWPLVADGVTLGPLG